MVHCLKTRFAAHSPIKRRSTANSSSPCTSESSLDLIYPSNPAERNEWIVAHRSQRNTLDPERPYACFLEEERAASGEVVPVATVFLTNRECPWRCAMCDLWKNTLTGSVARGAIPRQIDFALEALPK